uniref:Uncharacterized protein n=1 Tax=Romanomermis culicivorax TaxID=13658 RepID=A0A915L9W9_ROMCU
MMNRLLFVVVTTFIAPSCTAVKSQSISSLPVENGGSPHFGHGSPLSDVSGTDFSEKEALFDGSKKMERMAIEKNVERFGDQRSKKNVKDGDGRMWDYDFRSHGERETFGDGRRRNDEKKLRKRHTFHRLARKIGYRNMDLGEQEGDYRPRQQQTQQPAAIRSQPKREKQGILIAALCVVVVVLIITVGVVLYVFFYYHPERDMEDLIAEYRTNEAPYNSLNAPTLQSIQATQGDEEE